MELGQTKPPHEPEHEAYLEEPLKDFSQWKESAQKKLVEDLFSPYNTLNS